MLHAVRRKIILNNPWREIFAEWKGGSSFIASNDSGGHVQIGQIEDVPGIGSMQLLLAGLAGCTGGDVASILLKKRQPLKELKIQVRGKMTDEYPKVYTEIYITFLIWGEGIDPKAVEEAIQLSEEKYCSVGHHLKALAPIYINYQILSPGEVINKFEEIEK